MPNFRLKNDEVYLLYLLYVVCPLLHLLGSYNILVVIAMATNGPLKQIFQLSEFSTHNRLTENVCVHVHILIV